MPKYIAKQSIGHFMPGDEIKGLEEKHLQALLASGAIEEEKAPEQPKADGTAARLAELEKENAEQAGTIKLMTEEKAKSDQVNDGLSAKVADLEKALATSETALKKATSEAKKAPPADK
jgi:lia operon protein LiaH